MTTVRKSAPAYTLATLFGLAKEIGLVGDDAKDMAYSLIGKDSLKEFTRQEINTVCFELMARKDRLKRETGRITDRQLYKVREYERLLGWDKTPLRLAGQIERDYHVASVLWLTVAQAAGLIDGMKARYKRGQEEKKCQQ